MGPGDFKAEGERLGRRLRERCDLKPDGRILDVGCGVGRLAVPLTQYLSTAGTYRGFDIVPEAIAWCTERITGRYPQFRFQHVDLKNRHYNPEGRLEAADFRFPFTDRSFDVVVATSVFTHLLAPECRRYLREAARVLDGGGVLMATHYVLSDEAQAAIAAGRSELRFAHRRGPARVIDPDDPEATVAYERSDIEAFYREAGLRIEELLPGYWSGREGGVDYQDVVVARVQE